MFFEPIASVFTEALYDNTAGLWKIRSDLDIPGDLFKLQAQVATGYELNIGTASLQVIPSNQRYSLKGEDNIKARAHYKTCKYPEYNFWNRCYPEEARKLE